MRSRSNWKKLKSGNGNQKGISRICDRILWEKAWKWKEQYYLQNNILK